MGEFIEPFDFETIYLKYFIGNYLLFFYIFVMVLSFVCAYYNMSNRNYFILLAITSVIFAVYLEAAIMFILFFILGLFCYNAFRKLLQ